MPEGNAIVSQQPHPMPVDLWQEARRKGIGGTDISAILGINPWKSSFDVWLDKTGQAPPFVPNNRTHWGKRLEQIIAAEYSEVTKRPIRWVDEPMVGAATPIQVWTPDALCTEENRGLDAKTAGLDQSDKWGDPGTDQVPDTYALQAQWYLSASGRDAWDIAVLIGGNDFRIYTIWPDPQLQEEMVNAAEDWWNQHVVAGVPPEIGATPGCSEYLKKRFPKNSGTIRPANDAERAMLLKYSESRATFDDAKCAKDLLENALKLAVGEDDGIQIPGVKFTWKKTTDGTTTDWEAVAKAMNAPIELIEAHTKLKPGYRRVDFRLKSGK